MEDMTAFFVAISTLFLGWLGKQGWALFQARRAKRLAAPKPTLLSQMVPVPEPPPRRSRPLFGEVAGKVHRRETASEEIARRGRGRSDW